MKTTVKSILLFGALALCITACQKSADDVSTETETSTATSASTIAVASSATARTTNSSGTTADSVYIINSCGRGEQRDSIAESSLPASVSAYISANYAGATFHKAFSITNNSGTLTGYVVIVYYNDKPVALKFDATGTFVKVLEQRERGDLQGNGWHIGGIFQHRDGRGKDTIALTALPVTVQAYFTATYPTDTLLKAYRTSDSGYVVISKNNGLFATAFDAGASFKARVQLPQKPGRIASVEASALPAAITAYLQTTYPGYVFNKAFSTSLNGSIQGYVVLIDANNTRYAIAFDASGTFVAAKTIR